MPLLAGMRHSFTSYVSPLKHPGIKRLLTPPISEHSPELDSSLVGEHDGTPEIDTNIDGDTLVASTTKSRKRPREGKTLHATARKKHRTSVAAFSPELPPPYKEIDDDDGDSDFGGGGLETSTPPAARMKNWTATAKNAADRALMPPPSTPKTNERRRTPTKAPGNKGVEDYRYTAGQADELSEEETFTSSTAIRKNGPKEVADFDEQKALRHAEAISLPETGGPWAEAEKDLFFRLAFRGFEPLVPANWANDFKTLPSSLFSVDGGAQPLIKSHHQREFRAIHALRRLISMGATIRDRQRSRRNLRPEPILRRNVRHYISWALGDVGLHPEQRPNAIPVHTLVTMRRGETTMATIITVAEKLNNLANRYRTVYSVRESIEPRDSSSGSSEGTITEEPGLPVFIGIMICSSMITFVTLNPTTPSTAHVHATNDQRRSLQAAKDELGVRIIASFDFSDDRMDVWNALAIAICVMRIRKTMLELCAWGEANGENGKGGLWERGVLKGSKETEDPDV